MVKPQPFIVPPSYTWLGNDGPWSTFDVNIGTPPQLVRLLPGTSQSSIWTVINDPTLAGPISGCPSPPEGPSDCNSLRGELFDPLNSTTWDVHTSYYLPVDLEQYVGFDESTIANVSTEVIAFANGPPISNQIVAAYSGQVPFLGQFGLSAQPGHFTLTTGNASTLTTLYNLGSIPSKSYGYTAGAQYRTPQAYGSVILGGYDAARGNVKGVLASSLDTATVDPRVIVSSISIVNTTATTQVPDLNNYWLIDSLVAEIWLPTASCQAFEQAFGLTWDSTHSLYSISSSQRQRLQSQNPNVTFTLTSTTPQSVNTTSIVLPYASFDKQIGLFYPLSNITNDTTSYYFPLKQASNTSQYILGRTFMQEAYLAVDYDRSEFYISPATFPSDQSSQQIIAINPPGSDSTLTGGDIAGIVIGVLAALALLGVGLWLVLRRRRRQQKRGRSMSRDRRTSIGPTSTLVAGDEFPYNGDYFAPKPLPSPPLDANENEQVKAELDAQGTARGSPGGRHELEGDGSTVTAGRPHALSWGSAESGVSSITARMRGTSMDQSVIGQTSPLIGSPGTSVASPRHGRALSIEEQIEMRERGELHEME